MTITEIQNNAKTKMEKTKDVLRSDLMAIRAGRANPQLLDRITVDYYGTPTPLKNVANISAPEPRILQINPWDAKMVKDISRADQARAQDRRGEQGGHPLDPPRRGRSGEEAQEEQRNHRG